MSLRIELINTGSELMLGRILNTHQQWICRQMADRGMPVERQVAVADHGQTIRAAVQEALARADLVIVTGGLGPTSDDLTRDQIAQLLGKPLHEDAAVRAAIEQFYLSRNRPCPASTKVQALAPEGSLVLMNQWGTAPGLAMEISPNPFRPGGERSWLIMLPGPPRELRPMFTDQVLPLLAAQFPDTQGYACRILKTTGYGESVLEEKIDAPLKSLVAKGLDLGYCARVGEVEIRLGAYGRQACSLLDEAEQRVRQLLGGCIFTGQDESLETVIIHELTQRRLTLALAESCTGGFIGHRLTNVPGASAVFLAGLITYSNEAKQQLLGVPAEVLEHQGAVSEATARAMAEGARARLGADYAISVTGIAGPAGGSEAKPVGTVFMGLAMAGKTVVEHHLNRLDRESFKFATSQQALDLLRRELLLLSR